MARTILTASLALAGLAYAAAHPTLQATPHVVRAGRIVHISGRATGCPRIDSVTVISGAFVKNRAHNFAGLGAVYLRQRAAHVFKGIAHIRLRARGRYPVTARCGGANLGVADHVRVTAP